MFLRPLPFARTLDLALPNLRKALDILTTTHLERLEWDHIMLVSWCVSLRGGVRWAVDIPEFWFDFLWRPRSIGGSGLSELAQLFEREEERVSAG